SYSSMVNLHVDILNLDSELYRRLREPMSKRPAVEARIARIQAGTVVQKPYENESVKAMGELISKNAAKNIPFGKRLSISCATEGGGSTVWIDLTWNGAAFLQTAAHH